MSNVTIFDPAVLHGRFLGSDGDLSPNITTPAYTGGIPQTPGELKTGLVNDDGDVAIGMTQFGVLKRGMCKDTETFDAMMALAFPDP